MANLLPQHAKRIQESAISSEVIEARGYRSVTKKVELERLGLPASQRLVPALLIPVWDVHGEIATYQIRPDEPRFVRGKALKYETLKGSKMALDVPPTIREQLKDPSKPLFITEGARKADSAVSAGLCCIALLGVWNWRGTNDLGGKTALPDWEAVALNERKVYIVFDSDVMEKRGVHQALARLKPFLESKGASVRIVYLPSGPGAKKVGLDDYLAGGGNVDGLLNLAETKLKKPPGNDRPLSPYADTSDGRTVWNKYSNSGELTEVTLANFTARIVEDIVEDDGAEPRRLFRLATKLGNTESAIEVSAERFGAMSWAIDSLGPRAIVSAGMGSKDRLREAIQQLSSTEIAEIRIYTHTGWIKANEEWVFLHAGGALGSGGLVSSVQVRLQPPLDLYLLPDSPEGEELNVAIDNALGVFDGLAQDQTVFSLFSAVYRSALGGTNFSVHLAGSTGNGKTELAALAQQHFGADMDSGHIPGSWSSTANSLEGLAFLAKDTVLTVDDFNPTGSIQDVRRANSQADRVLRASGNRSGRGRMRADGSLRQSRPPRGFILSTGEVVPEGHSLRARLFALEIEKGELNFAKLTDCQAASASYSEAMAAFIRWIASRRNALQEEKKKVVSELRDVLRSSSPHARTVTIAAELIFGLGTFLRFCEEVGAITADRKAKLLERGFEAIRMSLLAQAEQQETANPALQYLEAVGTALRSQHVYFADLRKGAVPGAGRNDDLARALGWRLAESKDGSYTREEWRPGGKTIGWVDSDTEEVYLIPVAAYKAVQEVTLNDPGRICIPEKRIRRQLQEAGYIVSSDNGRRTKTVRIGERTVNALHLRLSDILGEAGTPGTSTTTVPRHASEVDISPSRDPMPAAEPPAPETPTVNQGKAEGPDPCVPNVPSSEGSSKREGKPPREVANTGESVDVQTFHASGQVQLGQAVKVDDRKRQVTESRPKARRKPKKSKITVDAAKALLKKPGARIVPGDPPNLLVPGGLTTGYQCLALAEKTLSRLVEDGAVIERRGRWAPPQEGSLA